MAITLAAAGKRDLHIVQGARFSEGYAVVVDGVRQPLDDYVATAQIRVRPGGDLVLDLDAYLSVDVTADIVWLVIPPAATRAVVRGGSWDLFLSNTSDPLDAVKLVEGRVSVSVASTIG